MRRHRSSQRRCARRLAERLRAVRVLGVFLLLAFASRALAQQPRLAEPSRADSLLMQGRLAAAEQALYAASDAKPRDPAARGALAAYLASRGRFTIALVLFDEAQRFGADPSRITMARAAILPYTTAAAAGEETTVPLTPAREPRTLGQVPVRSVRAAPATQMAIIDPNVTGVVVGRDAAQRFEVERGRPLRELWIGDRRLLRLAVRVDSLASADELRIGLDVLWGFQPLFDERAGTLTLGRAIGGNPSQQIPWLLTFPGLQLVPEVGQAPVRIESVRGRALLRGTRWQFDTRAATIRVDR